MNSKPYWPELDAALRNKLPASEVELLTSIDGFAAFNLLLPMLRELAMFLDGCGPEPKWFDALPHTLKSEAAYERVRIRRAKLERELERRERSRDR